MLDAADMAIPLGHNQVCGGHAIFGRGVIDELDSGTDGLHFGRRVITIGVTGTWQE